MSPCYISTTCTFITIQTKNITFSADISVLRKHVCQVSELSWSNNAEKLSICFRAIWYSISKSLFRLFLWTPVASFTVEVNPSLAKPPLNFNCGFSKLRCIFLVKLASGKRIIKSPRYTWDDFMFLYRFVRCRRRSPPQILVHAITFEQLFGFLSFLARLLVLTYRLTD